MKRAENTGKDNSEASESQEKRRRQGKRMIPEITEDSFAEREKGTQLRNRTRVSNRRNEKEHRRVALTRQVITKEQTRTQAS